MGSESDGSVLVAGMDVVASDGPASGRKFGVKAVGVCGSPPAHVTQGAEGQLALQVN